MIFPSASYIEGHCHSPGLTSAKSVMALTPSRRWTSSDQTLSSSISHSRDSTGTPSSMNYEHGHTCGVFAHWS